MCNIMFFSGFFIFILLLLIFCLSPIFIVFLVSKLKQIRQGIKLDQIGLHNKVLTLSLLYRISTEKIKLN